MQKKSNLISLVASLGIPLLFLYIAPLLQFFATFTVVEIRITAIFIMAALLWITEPIPNFATSLLVIVLELITISDKGFIAFRTGDVGTLVPYKDIMASFSAPIIILFLGGFTLALVAKKYKIDYAIANIILRPFGNKPAHVLLGLMIITALFSMFMSNTATTTMMLSILIPILQVMPEGDRIKTAFALGVPIAANIGGMGTPIGTPPNAIALRALTGVDAGVSFSQWMFFAIPFVLILLFMSWLLLIIFFSGKAKTIHLSLQNASTDPETQDAEKRHKKIFVYAVFVLTIVLWMTDFVHGINSYIVAMIPMLIFFITGICTKEDFKLFHWDVLWLVAGGIAIGTGLERTGLVSRIAHLLAFDNVSFIYVICISMLVMYACSNFMSHTAASNLLIPILVAIAYALPSQGTGNITLLIISVAFASSLAMILPISTPPNALAYGTGLIKTKHFMYLGLFIGIAGMIFAYFYLPFVKSLGFF